MTAIIFSLYSTYVYQVCTIWVLIQQKIINFINLQAGLAQLIYKKFRCALIICFLYFTLTSLHGFLTIGKWFDWPEALTALFILQRLCKFKRILNHDLPNLYVLFLNFLQSLHYTTTFSKDRHCGWVTPDFTIILTG